MNSKKDFSHLIEVYKKTKEDEKFFINSQSKHWESHYKGKDKFYNLENLINFRKNQVLSHGLDDAMNLQNSFNLLEALKYFDNDFLKKNLPKKNVGNCEYSTNFLGYWFDYGIIHHLKWYEKINKYIQNNFFILEIGGGFGSFARIILNNKNVKYFLIDLPEANLMTNFYLESHFPEKKIFNYSDFKEKKLEEVLNNYDIFILPPKTLENKNIKFDFIINARSFQEMNKKVIKEYFELIHTKIKRDGYFLNINRYSKFIENENIKIEDYPYDNFWNVEISEKGFLQEHLQLILTKRQDDKGNIVSELLKLKRLNMEWKSPKYEILQSIKNFLKRIIYFTLKTILTFFISKKLLKKMSIVLLNISMKNK